MPEFTRTNKDGLKKIADRLSDLDNYEIKAGWDKSAVYENGMPVAQIMAQNEFGLASRSIPARPFARPAVANDKPKWDESFKKASVAYLRGTETPDSVFDKMGLMMKNSLIDSIVSVLSPELSPITLQLRKFKKEGRVITGRVVGEAARLVAEGKADYSGVSTKPLNDSGYAISTVDYVVGKAK